MGVLAKLMTCLHFEGKGWEGVVSVWWVYGVWWFPTEAIIRLSQPSLAGVGAGAELGNNNTTCGVRPCKGNSNTLTFWCNNAGGEDV